MRAKRVVDADTSITDMAMAAIDNLIQRGRFDGEPVDLDEVDLLIYYSVAREAAEPATATLIQQRLGLGGGTVAFDVSDACIGFADAWYIADALVAAGRIRKALLVSAERISCISDTAVREINAGQHPRELYAALSLGDGASAALVGRREPGQKAVQLVAGSRHSYGEYAGLCILPALDKPMLTQAGRLFNIALGKFTPLMDAVLRESDWDIGDVELYITHQASLPSIQKGGRILGVPHEMAHITLDEYGNMASVSVPFTLDHAIQGWDAWQEKNILMVGFGSGLGVGIFTLRSVGEQA